MADLTVRDATPGDVPAIRRLAERGWTAAYGDFLSRDAIEAAMAAWYDADDTRERIERPDAAYFVAERDGDVVGYVSGGVREDGVAILGAIYVDPERWGEGIGTALLERFEAYCRRRDADVVEFEVLDGNDVGRSFYRKHGYEAVEKRETELFGETVTEHVFRGTLD